MRGFGLNAAPERSGSSRGVRLKDAVVASRLTFAFRCSLFPHFFSAAAPSSSPVIISALAAPRNATLQISPPAAERLNGILRSFVVRFSPARQSLDRVRPENNITREVSRARAMGVILKTRLVGEPPLFLQPILKPHYPDVVSRCLCHQQAQLC